jgi:hypothetical protein
VTEMNNLALHVERVRFAVERLAMGVLPDAV